MWAVEDTWLPLGPYAFAHTYTQAALGVRDSLTCKVEPKEVFMSSTAHKQKNPYRVFSFVGRGGFEPPTVCLKGNCSTRLSYRPMHVWVNAQYDILRTVQSICMHIIYVDICYGHVERLHPKVYNASSVQAL